MFRRYAGKGAAAVGTDKTLLNLFNSAAGPLSRAFLYELIIGCAAAPGDTATNFVLGRTTALGTEGSGYTPVMLDPANPAAGWDFGVAHSAEPTYTAASFMLAIDLNQRATFRWIAAPGSEIVAPATQNNGLGLKSSASTGTATHTATMLYTE